MKDFHMTRQKVNCIALCRAWARNGGRRCRELDGVSGSYAGHWAKHANCDRCAAIRVQRGSERLVRAGRAETVVVKLLAVPRTLASSHQDYSSLK